MHDAEEENDGSVVTMHETQDGEHEGFAAMHCL
jgi:hypothetical protein